jgi:hypothetical protein
MRPSYWFQLSGAAARQAAAGGGYYAKLSGINGLPVNMLLQISEDLSLGVFQFRTHPLFKKQDGTDAVRRILCAYLQHNSAGVHSAAEALKSSSSSCRQRFTELLHCMMQMDADADGCRGNWQCSGCS